MKWLNMADYDIRTIYWISNKSEKEEFFFDKRDAISEIRRVWGKEVVIGNRIKELRIIKIDNRYYELEPFLLTENNEFITHNDYQSSILNRALSSLSSRDKEIIENAINKGKS